jgi:hypothetical protein
MHNYQLYGRVLSSDWPLPCLEAEQKRQPDLVLEHSPDPLRRMFGVTDAQLGKEQVLDLPDGSIFVFWPDLMEFLVAPDGRRILGHPLTADPTDVLSAFFPGGVLSFALLRLGIEQLHATAVVIQGEAIGFMGDARAGKSSLAAHFVAKGYPLLTDDLMVLDFHGERILAQPGLPRLKLFGDSMEMLRRSSMGESITLNRISGKQIINLRGQQFCGANVRTRVLYTLKTSHDFADAVRIEPLSSHDAFLEICRATFNAQVLGPARLQQQFGMAYRVASAIPVTRLSFPRTFAAIPNVCESILADIGAAKN